ncbi:MAG TPA: SRPBCC family protein [Polyangiaceae bacterium]|nr:SRPBCC family protein [Polyangiaceae bacterium]
MAALFAGCASPGGTVHWPEPLSPSNADLFSHNDVVIARPCQRIWDILVNAPKWPEWYANASQVRLLDRSRTQLEHGSAFTWRTFGIVVESRVAEFEPAARLAWFGAAKDMTAYHAWLLKPLPDACRVITQETNNGPAAVALRDKNPDAIHDGHATWLAQLKAISERSE